MANIPKLKTEFNLILRLRSELQTKRDILAEKIDEIREQYNELIKHNSKKIYLYCLDSLYFQYKILRVELEQFQKTISLIFNRMYGDYYKLYNIIQSQCKENSTNILLSGENVVVYKDLDPFAEYNLDDLVLTHKIIIETLTKLHVLYLSKQDEINDHNTNMRIGFSVTSFISTLSYENKILGEHISLYSDYLSFYHSSQRKYLDNALYKINKFMMEIEEDILTNHKTYKTEKPDLEIKTEIEETKKTDLEIKTTIEETNSEIKIEIEETNLEINIEIEETEKTDSEIKIEIEETNLEIKTEIEDVVQGEPWFPSID